MTTGVRLYSHRGIPFGPPLCTPSATTAVTNPLRTTLTFLRTHNLWNSATKEVLGANIPQIALVMNRNEMWDQAINQFGGTLAIFGGGRAAGAAFDKLTLGRHGLNSLAELTPLQNQWRELGKSLTIYTLIGAYAHTVPFFRNWVTLKRTHADGFVDMVGLNANPVNPRPQNAPLNERLKAKERHYRQEFTRALGVGTAFAVGTLLATQGAIRKQPAFSAQLEKWSRPFVLPQGKFNQWTDLQTIIFGILPNYFGMVRASRDTVERDEILGRAGLFTSAYIFLPRLLQRWVTPYVAGRQMPLVGPGENLAFLAQLASSVVFCSCVPTLVNLSLRRHRAEHRGLLTHPPASPPAMAVTNVRAPTLYNPVFGRTDVQLSRLA